MNPEEYLEKAQEMSNEINEIYSEQNTMARILFESMKMNGVVQVSQGPTGMGKTLVILAVAKALIDLGKRVLISVPTYNHLYDNMIKDAKLIFGEGINNDLAIMFGKTNQRYGDLIEKCPRKLEICKNPSSKKCQEHTDECLIANDHSICLKANLVFTVHHYIVSVPSYMKEFDVVLIDESHGLPDVIRGSSQTSLSIENLEFLMKNETDPAIKQLLNKSLRSWKKAKKMKKIPKTLIDRIYTPIKNAATSVSDSSDLSCFRYYDLAQLTSDGRLYVTSYRRNTDWGESLSVGLISATIEDARAHVRDCQFNSLIMRPADKYETERFRLRFEKRPIFGLIDGPRLGKGDPQNYNIFRKEANEIIKDLVENTNEITLILCQNQRDARSIQKTLRKSERIKNRLTILPEDPKDVDSYELIIKDEIQNGKTVIIATASSRLWEGANVPSLKFLIIDALPYRRLSHDEKSATGSKRAKTWKSMKRFMLNRIQQGIGRLVRNEDDWGVAVILDNRFYTNHKRLFKELPNYIVSPQIFRWTEKDKIVSEVTKMIKRLKQGKSGRIDREITEFF